LVIPNVPPDPEVVIDGTLIKEPVALKVDGLTVPVFANVRLVPPKVNAPELKK
jgi:hypothetical protein